MKTISTIRSLRGALLALCIPALSVPVLAATTGGTKADTAAHPSATPVVQAGPVHSGQTIPAALQPVLYQALAKDAGAAYNTDKHGCAVLARQKLKGCFDNRGAHFTGATPLSLHLVAFGRGKVLANVISVRPNISGNGASYVHGNLTEWWRVLPVGFEQGFTIAKRPNGHGQLTLALAASRQDAGAPIIRHPGASGNPVKTSPLIPLRSEGGKELAWGKLRYGQLVVTDANGKVVPATLSSKGDHVLIAVNDAHAVYPLTVDPLVWLEQKVTASDGAAGEEFGNSVAVAGPIALVGTAFAKVNDNFSQGGVYVFHRIGGVWTQTQKLTASDGAAFDDFGVSIAIDGTTALVGAFQADVNGNGDQGAAYVFSESGGTWTQTQKLTASDGASDDGFGSSVALDGTTALVGADAADVNGNTNQGAGYVFDESAGVWNQTQKLTESDGAAFDDFGTSVALDGATALVGAPVAAVDGNPQHGAVYVFDDSGGAWTQTTKLAASDGASGSLFGSSVAVSGTAALVGARLTDVNGNGDQGAAYVFNESGGTWNQTQKLTASDGAGGDEFGSSVALHGATALIGAFEADVNGNGDQGAAYEFGESGGTWSETQKFTGSDGAAGDEFGSSVTLSGATILVGAIDATVNGKLTQGASYFFGSSDLGLAVSAPATVNQGQHYLSQTIATNNAGASSPAVSATITVPAGTNFVSATATQGSCSEASGVVTCEFGAIAGSGGTAKANVTLKATGNVGDTIVNTASIVGATPPLEASLLTEIAAGGGCPNGYTETDGTLAPGQNAATSAYQAPAGQENAILTAPAGFQLSVQFKLSPSRPWKTFVIPGYEVHKRAPAGTYRWVVKAKPTSDGGAYTLCIKHP